MMIEVPELPSIDRVSFMMSLGLLSAMEPETESLMLERAAREHVEDEHDSPHAKAWHLHFHGSQFPGDPLEACSRKLVYRMMNIPDATGPMAPWVTSTGVMGKAGELDIVKAWYEGGRMLGVPEDPTKPNVHQVSFVDREHWLTGSVDLAILPFGWRKPHIVEIKFKADDVIVEMLQGRQIERGGVVVMEPRPPDEAHVRQLKCGIGLAHEHDWGQVLVCGRTWRLLCSDIHERLTGYGTHPGSDGSGWCPYCQGYDCGVSFVLEPPTTGEIYYASRSWPRGNPRLGPRTKSFFYEYDPAYMESGRVILKEARQHFIDGTLPPRHPSMMWSVGPCGQCPAKRYCRLDEGIEEGRRKQTMEKRTTLAESNGVAYARMIRPHYSYQDTRERVLAEWREET